MQFSDISNSQFYKNLVLLSIKITIEEHYNLKGRNILLILRDLMKSSENKNVPYSKLHIYIILEIENVINSIEYPYYTADNGRSIKRIIKSYFNYY